CLKARSDRRNESGICDERSSRNDLIPAEASRAAGLIEMGEMCGPNETCGFFPRDPFPSLADYFCIRHQLRDRARQSERLECLRGRVFVEVKRAHFSSRSSFGSESSNALRSADFSVVVTSVRPSRVTTTRSFTPYRTTVPSSAWTTFPMDSTA